MTATHFFLLAIHLAVLNIAQPSTFLVVISYVAGLAALAASFKQFRKPNPSVG